MGITIQTLKENIFYVHQYFDRDNKDKQKIYGRRVRAGIFDTKINKYFYRRLLACMTILSHSKEFNTNYFDFFERNVKLLDSKNASLPDELSDLQKITEYVNFSSQKVDNITIPNRPIAYMLFMLISFYNINGLLNDFYIIFGRTLSYEKQQLEIQNWESLIKDDFLLQMLIFGLDELELCDNSEDYFKSLQDKFIEKQEFYLKYLESKKIQIHKSLYKSLYTPEFILTGDALSSNEVFDYLIKMSPEEKTLTKKMILDLFVFNISPTLLNHIENSSLLYPLTRANKISLTEALQRSLVCPDLVEYQHLQVVEKKYRYIDEEINNLFSDDSSLQNILEPFDQ